MATQSYIISCEDQVIAMCRTAGAVARAAELDVKQSGSSTLPNDSTRDCYGTLLVNMQRLESQLSASIQILNRCMGNQ